MLQNLYCNVQNETMLPNPSLHINSEVKMDIEETSPLIQKDSSDSESSKSKK